MSSLRRRPLIILTCLLVLMAWAGNAAAHRRNGVSLIPPVSLPVTLPSAPQTEATSGPLSLKPDSYWQRLLALAQAGDYQESLKTGLALVNLFPQASQRGTALLKLGELAETQGKMAEASELFGLVTTLTPGTQEASQACLAASSLELVRDLHQEGPDQALRQFLEKVSSLPAGYSPESLQEALKMGWQAVAQKVQVTSPLPLSLVEEVLALWDLQPHGVGPPEAAQLLADLLKRNGLVEEAQALLARASENHRQNQPKMLKTYSLAQPFLSGGCPDFTETLGLAPPQRVEEQNFLLPPLLPRWQAGFGPLATPGEAPGTWLPLQRAKVALMEGQAPGLGPTLLYSRPTPGPDRIQPEAGDSSSPAGSCLRLAQTGQTEPDKPMRGDGPFYQDRLGLSHLHEGQPDAAQETFQELAQNHDPFWQCLARVRLTDLEMSRLQAEPAP